MSDEVGWLNALFGDWPKELPARSRQWQSLYRDITNERHRLIEFVRATASGSKGGQRGQFIDPTALIPALRHVRRHWELSGLSSKRVSEPTGPVWKTCHTGHQDSNGNFPRLPVSNGISRPTWATEWRDKFGEDVTGQEAIGEIRELMNCALNSGIPFSASDRQALETALAELEGAQLDNSLRRAARLLENNEPLKLLPVLGRGRSNDAGDAVKKLLHALNQLLGRLEASVASRASTSGCARK